MNDEILKLLNAFERAVEDRQSYIESGWEPDEDKRTAKVLADARQALTDAIKNLTTASWSFSVGTGEVNIHPVDELAATREEIKQLTDRESQLRAALLAEGADLDGKQYQGFIQSSSRETVQKDALIAEYGRKAIEPFIKTTAVRSLKLIEKKE